jgi:hypothetical protein
MVVVPVARQTGRSAIRSLLNSAAARRSFSSDKLLKLARIASKPTAAHTLSETSSSAFTSSGLFQGQRVIYEPTFSYQTNEFDIAIAAGDLDMAEDLLYRAMDSGVAMSSMQFEQLIELGAQQVGRPFKLIRIQLERCSLTGPGSALLPTILSHAALRYPTITTNASCITSYG